MKIPNFVLSDPGYPLYKSRKNIYYAEFDLQDDMNVTCADTMFPISPEQRRRPFPESNESYTHINISSRLSYGL